MAIVMVFEVSGVTTEQYDRVNELMGVSGDNPPDGLIGHVCATTDDGLFITDVWESQEALDTFFQTRLGGALKDAGVPEVHPRVLPVYNWIRGRTPTAA
jgi:hypothetical protein